MFNLASRQHPALCVLDEPHPARGQRTQWAFGMPAYAHAADWDHHGRHRPALIGSDSRR
ncbi:protein of unknown function (plasmid) [Cupriavidus taiwanensis]|uniref:Uncharacterized protein n=1 Tax=Cupriavidus taiwanensis TaxID=164546 RepID=A0A375IW19_9BURK|nr:protein of unknown function [Cupriavidus taiwanensis]